MISLTRAIFLNYKVLSHSPLIYRERIENLYRLHTTAIICRRHTIGVSATHTLYASAFPRFTVLVIEALQAYSIQSYSNLGASHLHRNIRPH